MSKSRASSGFTLLELVVVLAILAVITTIATRSLDTVLDQNRFDASQRTLRDIEVAVLGDADERASDGSRVVSGFVADMGRLPRTVAESTGALSLRELWAPPLAAPYDARPAIIANGVPSDYEDAEVLVTGGWRGPYLRLPIGADDVRDGWGNRFDSPADASPANPDSTGYAHLRGAGDTSLTAEGQDIMIVRHLGANSTVDAPSADDAYNRDYATSFEGRVAAQLKASVQVDSESGPAVGSGDTIEVRVFSPDPSDASKIQVAAASVTVSITTSVVTVPAAPASITGLAVGRRPVRAYLKSGSNLVAKSAVKYVTLQPGQNFVEFTIHRP